MLHLNTITIRQADTLRGKFAIAADCGYRGLELWVHEVEPSALGAADREEAARRYGIDARNAPSAIDEALALAAEHGLALGGLCPASHAALRWHAALDPPVLDSLERTMAACAALGAGHVILPILGEDGSVDDTARNLGRLAERAGYHGVRLALEPVGHVAKCRLLPEALALLELADAGDRVGLVLDAFHFFRAGQTLADLDGLPASRLLAVHVNDAMDMPREALLGNRHRVYPGEGIWDVAGFCAAVAAAGWRGPYTVEILNDAYWRQPAEEVARRAFEAGLQVLARQVAAPIPLRGPGLT